MTEPQVEFNPTRRDTDILADKVPDKPAKDPTITVLLAAFIVCLILATVMQMMPRSSEPAANGLADMPPPEAPPAPEPPKATLTDRQIRSEKWVDNPGKNAADLGFAAIFYTEDPAFRRVQFGPRFLAVGEQVGDSEYTVARIDPHVVFLFDKAGKLHRLIEPGHWNETLEDYSWTGDKRPPDPPVRESGGVE